MLRDSVRFRRQLGLVHQDRLAALRLFVAGESPILPYLLTNLALLGFGRGAGEIRVQTGRRLTAAALRGQFLWRPDDEGLSLEEAAAVALERVAGALTVSAGRDAAGADLAFELEPGAIDDAAPGLPVLRGRVGNHGVWWGRGKWPAATPPPDPRSPLAPSLAALAGALLAQQALLELGLLRAQPIERVTLQLALDLPGLDPASPLDLRFDGIGEGSGLNVRRVSGDGVARLEVTLPPDLDVTWQLWERLQVVPRGPRLASSAPPSGLHYVSPLAQVTADDEREPPGAPLATRAGCRIVLGGVGGLGAWIAPLLAVSGLEEASVELIDHDTVDGHNLNRQVLFAEADLGRSKAVAAADRLRALDPATAYLPRPGMLTLEALAGDPTLAGADLYLNAFDNAYARYLLGMLAERCGRTLVDVGGGGLDGNLNRFDPERDCILCHWNRRRDFEATWAFARDRGARHCQLDDAGSPLVGGALVTTSAILASAATAVAIAGLAARRPGAGALAPGHQMTYLARSNELRKCPLQERAGADCSHHRHGDNHDRHVRRFLAESRLLSEMAQAATV